MDWVAGSLGILCVCIHIYSRCCRKEDGGGGAGGNRNLYHTHTINAHRDRRRRNLDNITRKRKKLDSYGTCSGNSGNSIGTWCVNATFFEQICCHKIRYIRL